MIKLYAQITEALAVADAAILEQQKEWAKRRMAAIREYKATPEYKAAGGFSRNYGTLFDLAGGKTWYEQFSYGERSALEFVEKNAKRNSEKRNAKIAAQLEKAGITSVVSGNIDWNRDGFDGYFHVMTDRGMLRVVVNTVFAGGYNIQCFHLRVLVKIV